MTDGAWLTTQDVAEARRVAVKTIYRYVSESQRRLRQGLPLGPTDIPVPRKEDRALVNRRWVLRWPDGPQIREWIAGTRPTEGTGP
jgi:hypothetical protein